MTPAESRQIEAQTGSDIYAELLTVEHRSRMLIARNLELEQQVHTLNGLADAMVEEVDHLAALLSAKEAALQAADATIQTLQGIVRGARR